MFHGFYSELTAKILQIVTKSHEEAWCRRTCEKVWPIRHDSGIPTVRRALFLTLINHGKSARPHDRGVHDSQLPWLSRIVRIVKSAPIRSVRQVKNIVYRLLHIWTCKQWWDSTCRYNVFTSDIYKKSASRNCENMRHVSGWDNIHSDLQVVTDLYLLDVSYSWIITAERRSMTWSRTPGIFNPALYEALFPSRYRVLSPLLGLARSARIPPTWGTVFEAIILRRETKSGMKIPTHIQSYADQLFYWTLSKGV